MVFTRRFPFRPRTRAGHHQLRFDLAWLTTTTTTTTSIYLAHDNTTAPFMESLNLNTLASSLPPSSNAATEKALLDDFKGKPTLNCLTLSAPVSQIRVLFSVCILIHVYML